MKRKLLNLIDNKNMKEKEKKKEKETKKKKSSNNNKKAKPESFMIKDPLITLYIIYGKICSAF